MKAVAFAVVFAVAAFTSVAPGSRPLVTLRSGALRGNVGTSRSGRPFYEFLGIPYGKVPLRFGLSEAADGWTGVRNATKPGPTCVQQNSVHKVTGAEECLVLNVYSPRLPGNEPEALLPVLLFIHGGAFVLGAGSDFGGKYLMSHDVVYVSFNYRLAAFGFLNAEMEGASGNVGLKDQILALKWVQQNIRKFGGDPNRVTIFGESAGSASVSLLTVSPMATGLFQRAISQSGTAVCGWADRKDNPLEEAERLAARLNCSTSHAPSMLKCLREATAEDIATATSPKDTGVSAFALPQFGPSVEKFQADPSTVFLPESPLTLLQQGNFNPVPWIVGVDEQEGILISAAPVLANSTLLEMLNKEWSRIAPSAFLFGSTARDPPKASTAVRKFYFGDETTPISQDNRQSLVDLYGDSLFTECTREAATLYAKHAPVFLYNFTHKVEFSFASRFRWKYDQKLKPPTHADELQFFFDFPVIPYFPGIPKGHPEEQFSENMIKLWISFAKNGRPTEWDSQPFNWPPLKPTEVPLSWMNIGQSSLQPQPENPHLSKRLDFWTQLNSDLRSESSKH